MNRLKFRVWDREKHRLLYDGFVIRSGEDNKGAEVYEIPTAYQNQKIGEVMNDTDACYSLIDWTSFYGLENLEVMQCTGFHDCEGNLIYEGDILEHNGIKDIIEWSYGCYVWNGTAIADYDSCFQGEPIGLDSKFTKIVGNKYEDKLY